MELFQEVICRLRFIAMVECLVFGLLFPFILEYFINIAGKVSILY